MAAGGFNLGNLLNDKSKAAAQKKEGPAEVQETGFEIVMLDVEDLMPSKDNFYQTENIEELAAAIELSGGIEQNLIVKPQAHGKYEVIAGHRRRLAALKLVNEGKEEYRKVPCRIKKESDDLRDKLSLILTNSSARQLTDWEKVQQAKELRETLLEYKQAVEEENKDKPKEERVKLGRIREIVAQMLNTSTTQIGRMEAIDNNLSDEFKQELEKGNINISTAHELSRLDEEKQAEAYQKYEEKGQLHIKDVKEEPKPEITDEQTEWVQLAIVEAIKGQANNDIFKVKDNVQLIEKALRKHFEKSFSGSKIQLEDNKHFIYRFSAEGITLIDMEWKNFLIEYSDLAEIVYLMIMSDILEYDNMPEVHDSEDKELSTPEEKPCSERNNDFMNEPVAAEDTEEEKTDVLPGQTDIRDNPELVPEPFEKGLSFTEWLAEKYGIAQYNMIKRVVRDAAEGIENKERLESNVTNQISIWVMKKTEEYRKYLLG